MKMRYTFANRVIFTLRSTRENVFLLGAAILVWVTVCVFSAVSLADTIYVPFVRVDVNGYDNSANKSNSGTLPGYNTMNFANATLTSTVTVNPGITVTVDRVSTSKNRDRNHASGDAVTNDFIFEQTTDEPITVTLGGLTVGKEYSLKIFSQDITANNGTHGTWSITHAGETSEIGVKTNSVYNATSNPSLKTTDSDTYLAYTFTAQDSTAVLTGLATDRFIFLNGIDVSEAYDPASGYTRFDVNSNHKDGTESRIMSPRSTELYVENGAAASSATATAPSGITMTITSDSVLNSRTRNKTNATADMNLYNDFVFSSAKVPFTTTLGNLSADTLYRLTVHSIDPSGDQSAGLWTMTNADGQTLFSYKHTVTFSDPSTWYFSQYIKPGTSSAVLLAELNGKTYTMLNGLELQAISAETSDYTWSGGRAQWLLDGKWVKKDGTSGTPAVGDVCYVTSSDATAMNTNYWLETTATPFEGTLVMATGSRLLLKSNATANDLILDGGFMHHGVQNTTYSLGGSLFVASDSTIDLDDGGTRTLTLNSVLTGSGNLNLLGGGTANSIVVFTSESPNYFGSVVPSKATIKLSGANATLGGGTLNLPSDSKLELAGANRGLHGITALTGNGPISVTSTSRFDLGTSEAQTYSGTISIAANQALHFGYTTTSADCASDVNLPSATVSMASGSTLGLIHQGNSATVTHLVLGTLNGTGTVRASGYVNANTTNYATLTIGQGEFSGVIGGVNASQRKLGLIKNTTGTLTLSGSNNYTGGTTLQAGKILLTGSGALGTGPVTISEAGTLEIDVADSAEKTMAFASTSKMTSAGKILKTGAGTLKIDAAQNSFDATTLTVQAGRLDMKECLTGRLEINNGAEFSPGNSVGKLTVNGSLALGQLTVSGDPAKIIMEIGGSASNQNDELVVTGDLEMNNGQICLELADGSSLNPGENFTVVLSAGNINEESAQSFIDKYVIAPNFLTNLNYGWDAGLGSCAITGTFNANAVPEPATWALLLLGAAGLMVWRKRK